MTDTLLYGIVIGALLGILHGAGIFVNRIRNATRHGEAIVPAMLVGGYYAIWTVLLWAVFGSYVVSLWVISVVIYVPGRTFRRLRSA